MAGPYTDENGVFKNKLGLSTEAELRAVEYELTTNRADELMSGRAGVSVKGYGLERQQAIHKHLFQDVYEWAGQTRTVPSRKRAENGTLSIFAEPDTIAPGWKELEKKTQAFVDSQGLSFEQKSEALADIFIEANRLHAFPEGNGRSLQAFMKQLAREQDVVLDYSKVNAREWNTASAVSGKHGRLFEHVHLIEQPPNAAPIKKIFADIASPSHGLGRTAPLQAAEHITTDTQRGQRPHNDVGGYRTVRPAVKAAGVLGTAYGAYDAKHQIDAATDTARSNREQWLRGGEEAANQTVKTAVTGTAATVGAIPGAAAGALTSPVTGPVGPIAGGIATGGAAAYGAEKAYEDSRLQQWTKTLGREVGQLGYDHVSKEGRLLRQVNGLKEDLQSATDPAERARLQGSLNEASAAFAKEAERNGRYFEGRAGIDKAWEPMHARFPKVDKDDVNDALARHIDAGKKPADAVRGAYSDAVHEQYPRALPHEPVENYQGVSNQQLAEKHRQYVGEVAQDRRAVESLAANRDSHNNIDQGWPKVLAQQRQASRVQEGLNEFWRDTGHLGAIRDVYKERGLQPPELPTELRPTTSQTTPTRSGQISLTPEQQRHRELAQEQLSPALRVHGHDTEGIDRVSAAAVGHAQEHAHRGSVRQALSQTSEQHLAQVQQTVHEQTQRVQEQSAPSRANPAIG